MAESTDRTSIIQRALAEDLGSGDLTARLIDVQARAAAEVVCRDEAVVCGRPWFDEVFQQLDPDTLIEWAVEEGQPVTAGTRLCQLEGNARALLSGERTALNLLQTLSATATRTRQYVDAVAGTGAVILDTRKTLPGLRNAQKYAVRCGGGQNHRMGLFDAILIKENHIVAAGSISRAVTQAREIDASVPVEVEVENFNELNEALAAGADRVLLDNMEPAMLREAVALTAGRAKLEASGGIDLDNVRAVAETGVDFISIGALTKDIQAVDLSMRFALRP